MTFSTITSHFLKTFSEPRTVRGLFFGKVKVCFNESQNTQKWLSALWQAIFWKLFRNHGLSADYFWLMLKCVLTHSRTLKNDLQHYHKPFSENFFGTTDCPRTVCGLFLINAGMCFNTLWDTEKWLLVLSQAIFWKLFRSLGLSAGYFREKFKCVSKKIRSTQNDFQHYPKPLSAIGTISLIDWYLYVATDHNLRVSCHRVFNADNINVMTPVQNIGRIHSMIERFIIVIYK